MIFFKFSSESVFFQVTFVLYTISSILYLSTIFVRKRELHVVSRYVLLAGFVFNTIMIVERWVAQGRPPFKTLYESLILFTWCIIFFYLIIEVLHKVRLIGIFFHYNVGYSLDLCFVKSRCRDDKPSCSLTERVVRPPCSCLFSRLFSSFHIICHIYPISHISRNKETERTQPFRPGLSRFRLIFLQDNNLRFYNAHFGIIDGSTLGKGSMG